jgi:hypothetical protein
MIARIQKFNEIIKILGIDMSRAFDTIIRQKILESLRTIISEDSWRIIQKLLTNTTIKVKIANKYSTPFKTNIGAPQGDALSPVLFTVYLELALQEIRAACERSVIDKTIPNEICYADDTDFITKSDKTLEEIQTKAPAILKKWNLEMNSAKTEITTLKREPKVEQEKWRKTKKLGTMLGDNEEIKRRKQLAAFALNKMKSIWKIDNKIGEQRRLQLYKAYIHPILTYNMGTWSPNQNELEQLEVFHRRQLRSILAIYYPNIISNEDLYKKCKTTTLENEMRVARWQLLGHVLRMTNKTPAKNAMLQYFNESDSNGFRGQPKTTLPILIEKDIQKLQKEKENNTHQIPNQLTSIEDLKLLEKTAKQRKKWLKIIVDMQTLA